MAGERINIRDVMIPGLLDDVLINKIPSNLDMAYSHATSVYSGRGRPDQDKSWKANSSVYNSVTGGLLMRISGLNYVKLDVPPKPDPHTLDSVSWEPDVTLLTQDQMMYLDPAGSPSRLNRVVDLIAYKKPALKVLEVNLDQGDTSCLWFWDGASSVRGAVRKAYAQYDFASSDGKAITSVQTKYQEMDNTRFLFVDPSKEALGLAAETTYDLAIIKGPRKAEAVIGEVIKKLRPVLAAEALTLVVHLRDEAVGANGQDGMEMTEDMDNALDLGMIVDVGHIAEDESGLEDKFDKTRWIPLGEAMLRRVLTYSILQQDHRPGAQFGREEGGAQLVTGIAHPLPHDEADTTYDARFGYLYASSRGSSKQGGVGGGDGGGSDRGDKGSQAVKTLQVMHSSGADAPALVKVAVDALSGQFSKILQLSDEVEPGKPLMAYGLDSLSAIELRNWARQKIGVELATLDIINATSLIALAEKVVSKMAQPENAGK